MTTSHPSRDPKGSKDILDGLLRGALKDTRWKGAPGPLAYFSEIWMPFCADPVPARKGKLRWFGPSSIGAALIRPAASRNAADNASVSGSMAMYSRATKAGASESLFSSTLMYSESNPAGYA